MGLGNTNQGFSGGGGGNGSGGSDGIYRGTSPTTITVGGEPAGTDIYGKSFQQLFQDILVPFIIPSFASFYNNVNSPQEVGTTLSGNKTFVYSFNTVSNVQDNSISIEDFTTSTVLATGLSIAQGLGVSINIGTITNSSPTTHIWQITGLDVSSNPLTPSTYTILFYWREWYGNNALTTLTAADIQNTSEIQNSYLSGTISGTYPFAAGGYKWMIWDNGMGSPAAVTGFKDAATNLQVSMADNTDDPIFFSNVENGWYYGLVSVTQNGVTSNKRCYRTKYELGGAVNIIVTNS